jgi:hypothetical protein
MNTMLIDDADHCVIGYNEADGRVVYDYTQLVEYFHTSHDMTEEEAREWISFNIEPTGYVDLVVKATIEEIEAMAELRGLDSLDS